MRWTVLVGAVLCTACVSHVGEIAKDRPGRTKTYVGIVRVHLPAAQEGLHYADIKTLGLGWDGSVFAGWRAGQWVTADPGKCQLLVIVRSGVEAGSAATLFNALGENRACIADFRDPDAPAPQPSSPPRR